MNNYHSDTFSLINLIEDKDEHYTDLYYQHVNPVQMDMLGIIGFDRRFIKGKGAYVWDNKGAKYLDFLSGFGIFNMGRNHPTIKKVVREYLSLDDPWKLAMGTNRLAGFLAEALLNKVPHLDKVYFANTGTECVETALKFCRTATGKETVVYANNGFHGLTYGSLSMNGSQKFRKGFGRFLPGTKNVPLNDLDRLKQVFDKEDVAGVILEPIQGKGVYPAHEEYLLGVQRLCKKHHAVMILDEIQTGMGRTGTLFCYQHISDLEPDMVLVSKSLSGGMVPVGAVLMREHIYKSVYSSLDRGKIHSSTFGEGGLAMACGLASLHVIESESLSEHAEQIGTYLLQELQRMVSRYKFLKEVRGKGLMIGIEFENPPSIPLKPAWHFTHLGKQSLFPQSVIMPLIEQHHILTQVAAHNVDIIKILPPLTINKKDADWFLDSFRQTLNQIETFSGPVWSLAKHFTTFKIRSIKEKQ